MRHIFLNPRELINSVGLNFLHGNPERVLSPKWQGLNNSSAMLEIFDEVLRVKIPETQSQLLESCRPDMPWAEDHFQERISGNPSNPGETYKSWPYYKEDSYREGGKFTHTYMERFWPKYAGSKNPITGGDGPNWGIRYRIGDLRDVINHLIENPQTRQAYLPIWFPEDTGVLHGGRVPCTLGYLFNIRKGYLHCSYYLRSCDYIRHFKNDVYFAGRLMQHIVEQLNLSDISVKPGNLKIDIDSFHIFESDLYELKKRLK